MSRPTCAIIISTYNWPEALRLNLLAIMQQTIAPDEVIVADDGSNVETRNMIDAFRVIFPCRLIHVWHEDEGWRKCTILNKAIAKCQCDYIIQLDQDIITDKHFVEDHLRNARKGYYAQGSRAKIDMKLTEIICKRQFRSISFATKGVYRKLNAIRMPLLTFFLRDIYKRKAKERGCNMAFWRNDLININGYDERMIGWGAEDTDLGSRLRKSGLKKQFLKFSAICFHIHHKQSKRDELAEANSNIRRANERNGIIRVQLGIDQW